MLTESPTDTDACVVTHCCSPPFPCDADPPSILSLHLRPHPVSPLCVWGSSVAGSSITGCCGRPNMPPLVRTYICEEMQSLEALHF